MKLDLDVLNQPQREAVLYGDGPLMVIAGAGSGKTRCLTYRAAHLLKRGVLPSRMMVTTFTAKATEEMTERLAAIVGHDRVERLKIGTFHSLFRKILLELMELNDINYETPSLIQGGGQFFVHLNYMRSNKKSGDIKEVLRRISLWKNDGKRIQDVEADPQHDKEMLEYYRNYENHLKENNKIDFDDMLFKTYWLLQEPNSKEYLARLQKRTDYILVDEGQDLNKIQFLLVKMVAGTKRNVTLVLDDFQVLYGFRGSDINNIFQFIEDYKPHTIKLEQNYRSTKTIVGLGNKLIKHNKRQIEKVLFTDNQIGTAPTITVSVNEDDEAEKVLEAIQFYASEGYALNEMAVLYRTNSQSRAMVDILIRHDVPHIVHSNFGFYDRREVKDIISYLRIVSDPWSADLEDFRRILNKPSRFIGAKFLDAVETFQVNHDMESFWEAMTKHDCNELNSNQFNQVQKFVRMVQDLHNELKTNKMHTTGTIIKLILDRSGYGEWLRKEMEDEVDGEPDDDKELNLDALMAGADRFKRVDHFLRYVDSIDQNGYEDEDDVVHLMTVHKAKGTEYQIVFVIGLSEGLLPHYKCDDIEEERRVAYVAVTRAKEELILSLIHGKYGRRKMFASRFFNDMQLKIPQTLGGERVGYVSPVGNGFPTIGPPLGIVKDALGGQMSFDLHGAQSEMEVPNLGTIPMNETDEE